MTMNIINKLKPHIQECIGKYMNENQTKIIKENKLMYDCLDEINVLAYNHLLNKTIDFNKEAFTKKLMEILTRWAEND